MHIYKTGNICFSTVGRLILSYLDKFWSQKRNGSKFRNKAFIFVVLMNWQFLKILKMFQYIGILIDTRMFNIYLTFLLINITNFKTMFYSGLKLIWKIFERQLVYSSMHLTHMKIVSLNDKPVVSFPFQAFILKRILFLNNFMYFKGVVTVKLECFKYSLLTVLYESKSNTFEELRMIYFPQERSNSNISKPRIV